jgi:uncharacterized protein (DUF2267 family)
LVGQPEARRDWEDEMELTQIHTIERNLQKMNEWIKEIEAELGVENPHSAYKALRAVLHALRDRVTAAEACDLGAQLPLIARGIYYEAWKPNRSPQAFRHAEAFLERISTEFASEADPTLLLQAVLKVLAREIDPGVLEHVYGMMPGEVQDLWPEEARQRRA